MIQRKRMMARSTVDYEYEATRHMCEGCNKSWAGGRVLTGYVCTVYRVKPGMYLRANECPVNPRKRPPMNSKIRVGQQKQS